MLKTLKMCRDFSKQFRLQISDVRYYGTWFNVFLLFSKHFFQLLRQNVFIKTQIFLKVVANLK